MPVEIKIPSVGESITEVQITEWLKSEGDSVKQDEPIAVIDSEKTTFELPAPGDGKLTTILHQAGETVAVGAVVAQLEAEVAAGKSKPQETMAKRETKGTGKSGIKTESLSWLKRQNLMRKPLRKMTMKNPRKKNPSPQNLKGMNQ